MGWGEIPVQEFYGIHHTDCPQIMLVEGCDCVYRETLVGLAAISASRQIERNQGESCFPIKRILKTDDMLMAL